MESQLIFLYVLPEQIWSQYTGATADVEFENEAMIGSGPFKMVECRQNEYVRLPANKEHYLTPPNPIDLPQGYRFRPRCPMAFDRCAQVDPALVAVGDGHAAACPCNSRTIVPPFNPAGHKYFL